MAADHFDLFPLCKPRDALVPFQVPLCVLISDRLSLCTVLIPPHAETLSSFQSFFPEEPYLLD